MSILIELSEAQFQSQVVNLASMLGWQWLHVVTTGIGRHAPVRGPLGAGWPDLLLIRDHRMIVAELKKQKSLPPSVVQRKVLDMLEGVPSVETYVWRPADMPFIMEVLA